MSLQPRYSVILFLTLMLSVNFSVQGEVKAPSLKGPYLGQTPPGVTPEVFAPGVISTSGWEVSGVFSPDLNQFYYIREVEIEQKLQQQFVVFENHSDGWRLRVISNRVGQPFISPDSNTMHLGRRYKTRTDTGWSEIKNLSKDFTQYRIMRLTASSRGTYVFDEATQDGKGLLRISRLVDGEREAPMPLPEQINTGLWNAHPFIAPDESYIIWDGQRDSDVRNADLFISFREADGSWSDAIKFGSDINTTENEGSPRVTPDGKYLFFRRKVGSYTWTSTSGETETIPNTDVFWVDAKVIDDLRPSTISAPSAH